MTSRQEFLDERFQRDGGLDRIPDQGRPDEWVMNEVRTALARTAANYTTGEPSCKPGTVPNPLAVSAYVEAMTGINPNSVDPFMFHGTYELEQEAIAMTACLLNHPEEGSECAGWFLSGGTEAINQATWIYRNAYFHDRMLRAIPLNVLSDNELLFRELLNLRTQGWFGIAQEWNRHYDSARKVPVPKILASFRSHFAIDKAADLLGFGQRNVEHVFGNETGHPTPESLSSAVAKVLDSGDEIAMVWLTMGDTEFGRTADIGALGEALSETIASYSASIDGIYEPPILVDAAAQWLFAAVAEGMEEYKDAPWIGGVPPWDFKVPQVQAIVCDAHKQPIPYPASILLLRDLPTSIRYTMMHEAYLHLKDQDRDRAVGEDERKFAQIHATIPTTRPGYGPVATWAYYAGRGIEGIRSDKAGIWRVVTKLRDEIVEGRLRGSFEPICEPETAIVAFTLKRAWVETHAEGLRRLLASKEKEEAAKEGVLSLSTDELVGWTNEELKSRINESREHALYIATSEKLRIRDREESEHYRGVVAASEPDKSIKQYSGLIVHIMEHNTLDGIEKLVLELDRQARELVQEARAFVDD